MKNSKKSAPTSAKPGPAPSGAPHPLLAATPASAPTPASGPDQPPGSVQSSSPPAAPEANTPVTGAEPGQPPASLVNGTAPAGQQIPGFPPAPPPSNNITACERFNTGYQIVLSGGLREGVFKEVLINGRSFKLELRQFVVLLILACRALTMAALPSPLRIEGELFLPAKAIVAEVEALATRLKARGLGTWESKHVWNAVWEMREMFQAAGANPNLIQVERGYGYRLSVPPANIIALFDSSV